MDHQLWGSVWQCFAQAFSALPCTLLHGIARAAHMMGAQRAFQAAGKALPAKLSMPSVPQRLAAGRLRRQGYTPASHGELHRVLMYKVDHHSALQHRLGRGADRLRAIATSAVVGMASVQCAPHYPHTHGVGRTGGTPGGVRQQGFILDLKRGVAHQRPRTIPVSRLRQSRLRRYGGNELCRAGVCA